MDNPRLIGHIVSVQGFRVKVELLPETRSALRATLDGVQVAIAINAYLTFSLGAGETVIGIITDLEARESFDPSSGDDLSLELMKPRRIASVQLLGTIEHADDEPSFSLAYPFCRRWIQRQKSDRPTSCVRYLRSHLVATGRKAMMTRISTTT